LTYSWGPTSPQKLIAPENSPIKLPRAPDQVAVFSDIHIGNGANTCWYQNRVHEPYLVHALDWVTQNADMFREVVLLGDLVDLWTYPPSVRPPSMADIIAANPNVLGPGGALSRVVKAVPKVTLLLGNHDGTLKPADIATLQSAVGPIELVDPVHVLTGSSGARTVFSHGHYWTMFNAPDDRSPWNTLPVGHFVTRAFSYMMANQLKPGETVADRADMGYPNGFNLLQFLQSLNLYASPDIADMLLDYVAHVANMSESLPIVLPDGEATTIAAAKKIYADLFTRWVAQENNSVLTAARAALADGSGEYLAWFAQRLAIQQSADLVVLGHTHTPVGGVAVAPINYLNSGFECATVPDNPPKLFTFTVVDVETASAETMMVRHGDYAILPAPAPPMSSVVLWPAVDYSCYVRIINKGPQPLTLTQADAAHGNWVVPPTQTIPAGGRGDGWLQDYAGVEGTDGTFTYKQGGATLPFSVSCPTYWWNTAAGAGGNFVARSGSGEWGPRGQVPARDRPLQVIFTVGA
jgi:UDP-2,3-diacylglucosamine pyrophosphatase LpxH